MEEDEVKTLTVAELVEALTKYPNDTKVYISRDEEGNGYGTLATDAIDHSAPDKAIILYPVVEHLDYDEIFPKELL